MYYEFGWLWLFFSLFSSISVFVRLSSSFIHCNITFIGTSCLNKEEKIRNKKWGKKLKQIEREKNHCLFFAFHSMMFIQSNLKLKTQNSKRNRQTYSQTSIYIYMTTLTVNFLFFYISCSLSLPPQNLIVTKYNKP